MIAKFIPTEILCVLFVVLIVALSQAVLVVFNTRYGKRSMPYNNEITGIIFAALSLIYSLLVAFVIVAVWEDYEELNNTIEKEADKLNSIIVHSSMLPDSLKNPIQSAVGDYCKRVVNEEWEMQEENIPLRPSAIPSVRLLVLSFLPQTKIQESVFVVLDENLSDISDLRRERLSHTRSHVPGLVWFILQAGSIIIILFSYLLFVESLRLKRICVSFLSGMIAMSLFLVYMLDHPFTGSTQVSNKTYKSIIQTIHNSDSQIKH
jgi:hypothetical protein